jgi:hypothetical protein
MGIFDFFRGKKRPVKKAGNTDKVISTQKADPSRELERQRDLKRDREERGDQSKDPKQPPQSVSWSFWPEEVEDVLAMLNQEIDHARSQGLRVLIYSFAPWSPGSVAFRKAREHQGFASLLHGRMHVVDVQYGTMNKLNDLGFEGYKVPQLYLLEQDGRYEGRTTDGGAWGADTPENITRVLRAWFLKNGIQTH